MNVVGIIPARYASTRFPGKPLALIHGRSMIERVYRQCQKSKSLSDVLVATDDERIFEHVSEFGGTAVMTRTDHPSGTDRCAEVCDSLIKKPDVVINIQGDEPYIHPEQIDLIAGNFVDSKTEVATLIKVITDPADLSNSNVVKVVRQKKRSQALYFSRQQIPYCDPQMVDAFLTEGQFFRHVGIYGYRSEVLAELTKLKPSDLESAEKLEQLRWLENGYTISAVLTTYSGIGVDKPEDIQLLESRFSAD